MRYALMSGIGFITKRTMWILDADGGSHDFVFLLEIPLLPLSMVAYEGQIGQIDRLPSN